jgi:hypothetical protein
VSTSPNFLADMNIFRIKLRFTTLSTDDLTIAQLMGDKKGKLIRLESCLFFEDI